MLTGLSAHDWLARKLGTAFDLTAAEQAAVEALPIATRLVGAGGAIVPQGGRPGESCIVLDGIVCTSRITLDGGLQITSLFVPGDIPDLQSLHLDVLDHALTSLTKSRLGFIPHKAILKIAHDHPRIGVELWRETLVYAAIYADWVFNIGGRSARTRVGHLFCELHARLRAAGVDSDGKGLGLTQVQLGEATGLSTVHINRVMQSFRADGLVSKSRNLTVPDWDRLAQASQFDPAYLHIR